MKTMTLETIYKKMVSLERDILQLKKSLVEEPGLRKEFIARMRDIDAEKAVPVKDFDKRYGLRKRFMVLLSKNGLIENSRGLRRKTGKCCF